MPLKSISEIRRRELIEVAYRLLIADGLHTLTVEKVARAAGASKGIIHHYFSNKTELIESALAHLSTFPGGVTAGRLEEATTPSARIWTIVKSNLRPEIFQPAACRAWFAICSDTKEYPLAKKQVRQYYAFEEKEFLNAFETLLDKEEAVKATTELVALLDGLWVKNSLRSSSLGSKWAMAVVRDYLTARCPKFDVSVVKPDDV